MDYSITFPGKTVSEFVISISDIVDRVRRFKEGYAVLKKTTYFYVK